MNVEEQQAVRKDDGELAPYDWVKDAWNGDGKFHPLYWIKSTHDGRYYHGIGIGILMMAFIVLWDIEFFT